MAQWTKGQTVKIVNTNSDLDGKEGIFVETVYDDGYFDIVEMMEGEIWFRFECLEAVEEPVEYTYDMDAFSDLYKDTYNFRPRGHRFYNDDTTPAERQEMWDNLLEAHDREMERYEEEQIQRDARFEDSINYIIDEAGAPDRETAIRWLIDAEFDEDDLMYGFSHMAYNFGITDKFRTEVQAVIDSMIEMR